MININWNYNLTLDPNADVYKALIEYKRTHGHFPNDLIFKTGHNVVATVGVKRFEDKARRMYNAIYNRRLV